MMIEDDVMFVKCPRMELALYTVHYSTLIQATILFRVPSTT